MMNLLYDKLKLASRFLQAKDRSFASRYLQNQIDTLTNIYNGKPYTLCTYYFPSELANLFDTNFIYIERIVGLAVSLNILKQDVKTPLPCHICSYQKAFLHMLETGLVPSPERIIAVKYPCRDAVTLCEYIHNTYQIPIHYIDTRNLKKDLQEVYACLEKQYSKKSRISEVVDKANTAKKLKQEIDDLRIRYPGILPSDDFLKIFPVENDFGSVTAVAVLQDLLHCIKNKTKNYVAQSKLKILWMGLIPLYNNNILSKAEEIFPCQFVYEEMWMFENPTFSGDHFFEDLARKIETSFFYDVDKRIQKVDEIVKKTEADIVINFSQKNCSFLPKTIPAFRDYFTKNSIGFYNLSSDVIQGDFDVEHLYSIIKGAGYVPSSKNNV